MENNNLIFIRERLYQYLLLTRFHRPIGILLLLWPTLWALWFAGNGHPDPLIVMIFILGTALMRGAGCAINDYADRNFDPFVRRTQMRPLAAGRIHSKEAIGVFVILTLLAFILVLQLNQFTIQLSVIGALLTASYPFTKRYTNLPQFYLGFSFGWAIPMAFAAQTGVLSYLAWAIFFATVSWAVAYDTIYAMVDRADDLKIGVKSTAILFGCYDRFAIAVAHGIVLLILIGVGIERNCGSIYFFGLTAATGLAIYQQWLIRLRDEAQCWRAFLNNNWFGCVIFLGIVGDYLIRDW